MGGAMGWTSYTQVCALYKSPMRIDRKSTYGSDL